jgi:hypothetical protein
MNQQPENKVNSRLTQQSQSNGEVRTFEIYNEQFIKARRHNLLGKRSYHLNLSLLQPWPVHHRQFSKRWLAATSYFALTTLVYFIFLIVNYDQPTLSKLLPFIVVLTLFTIGFLISFIYHSPNVMEFRSRYGNCTVLRLFHNKPNKEDFRHFSDELRTRILVSSQDVNLDKKHMLEMEQQELLRLKEEGVITGEAYAEAMERIQGINI